MKFILPDAALIQHIAITGKSGSGKTNAAKVMVERFLREGRRVCIIDPTGAWWGLKSNDKGSKAMFKLTIFGGAHGDFPLADKHGALVAELVATTDLPCIIDTSEMGANERTRFMADFAETLYKKNVSNPLHLVMDEAHEFAPQMTRTPQAGIMLNAVERMVTGGRVRGFRVMMVTQRPAALNKSVLTQVETLIAFRMTGAPDRHAIEDWIAANADKATGKEILQSLASLPTGEGWVWSPESAILTRWKFPKSGTYDSGKAPTGEQEKVVLATIDNAEIEKRMGQVAAEVAENDPKRLKARIAELEKAKGKPDQEALRRAEEAGHARGVATGRAESEKALAAIRKGVAALNRVAGLEEVKTGAPDMLTAPIIVPSSLARAPHQVKTTPAVTPSAPRDTNLPQGEKAILCALAQYPEGCTREQLTVLTGFKRSTRDAYIQRLRGKDYATVDGVKVLATPAGVDALGDAYEPLPSGQALRDYWIAKLPEGESKLLSELLPAYPDAVERDALSDATGFKRSTRDAYLQRMKAKQLVIIEGRGGVRAADTLFG